MAERLILQATLHGVDIDFDDDAERIRAGVEEDLLDSGWDAEVAVVRVEVPDA